MRALITGASGFLGTHLLSHLSKLGCELYTLGNSKIEGYKHYYIENTISRPIINKAIEEIRPDFIFHLAGDPLSNNILQSFSVNTFYALEILQSLEDNNLDQSTKVILIGSAAEYGFKKDSELPISESQVKLPMSLYGRTKLAQTEISMSWQEKNRKLFVLRPFNIIGPRMPLHLAMGSFINQIRQMGDKGILETGNLNVSRDFIDVRDAVNLMWNLANNENSYGEVINLSSGSPSSLNEIVDKMVECSGKDIIVKTRKALKRKNDMKIHYGDNSKLLQLVGNYRFLHYEETIMNVFKSYV